MNAIPFRQPRGCVAIAQGVMYPKTEAAGGFECCCNTAGLEHVRTHVRRHVRTHARAGAHSPTRLRKLPRDAGTDPDSELCSRCLQAAVSAGRLAVCGTTRIAVLREWVGKQ